jgi:hypothetical protein
MGITAKEGRTQPFICVRIVVKNMALASDR